MLRRLLLLFASIALALLVGELAVRVSGLAPEVGAVERGRFRLSANRRLGYEPAPPRPGATASSGHHGYEDPPNRLGFRDRDHLLEAPKGLTRIVLLGDSIAEGAGVPRFEETLPAQLEQAFAARGVAVEVINLGVRGYHTGQQVEMLLGRGLAFAPDLVLVAYCLNDRRHGEGQILASLLAAEAGRPDRNWSGNPLLLDSALFRLLRFRVFASDGAVDRVDEFVDSATERRAAPRPRRSAADREVRARFPDLFRDTVPESFARLAELGQQHGFTVAVAIFPFLNRLEAYPLVEEHRHVASLLAAHQLVGVDLLPSFLECRARQPDVALGVDKLHPSPAGHICAATAIAEALSPGLLPG